MVRLGGGGTSDKISIPLMKIQISYEQKSISVVLPSATLVSDIYEHVQNQNVAVHFEHCQNAQRNCDFRIFPKGKILLKQEDRFFPEQEDLPLLEVTAETGLWDGLLKAHNQVQEKMATYLFEIIN